MDAKCSHPLLLVCVFLLFTPPAECELWQIDRDSTIVVIPSNQHITIQFDTTVAQISSGEFFNRHPCLDQSFLPQHVGRGFWVYGISQPCGYAATASDLSLDETVNRAIPVYLRQTDSGEFQVTDLITIRFEPGLSAQAMDSLATANGLVFVDSMRFAHGWRLCALHDSIKSSPLSYANRMCLLTGSKWAGAEVYTKGERLSEPSDSYFIRQYWLRDRDYPYRHVDIDADSAWMVSLVDSSLKIAILDDGIDTALDLPWSRIAPGFDVAGPEPPANPGDPQPIDFDARPGYYNAHGMSCAGILAASHNGVGIVGVHGSCRIIPVKIFYDERHADLAPSFYLAEAFFFAASQGAKVISNSWWLGMTCGGVALGDYPTIIEAIEEVTQPDPPYRPYSCVVVFAAGNYPPCPKPGPVNVLATDPDVLAVGAEKRGTDSAWIYSGNGPELDVVAPSGDSWQCGDMWTMDQMGECGVNPDNQLTCYPLEPQDRNFTATFGGTSGACSQVAGIAALILARRPDFYTAPGWRDTCHLIVGNVIRNSAIDLPPVGFDNATGYGRANAYRALLSVIRGDVDNNARIDTLDVRAMDQYCFHQGAPPVLDRRVADTDGDYDADIIDYLRTLDAALNNKGIPPSSGPAPCNPCACSPYPTNCP